eukprot:14217832-Heterocapsa_arctica.AAC.1
MDLSSVLALVPGSCDCVSEPKARRILRARVRAAPGRPVACVARFVRLRCVWLAGGRLRLCGL